jgi:pilus assembly protein Flp/PilA
LARQLPRVIIGEEITVKDTMLKLYIKMQNLLSQDEGQDLIEYALVVAIIALGATAAMNTLAGTVNSVFTSINAALSAALPAS